MSTYGLLTCDARGLQEVLAQSFAYITHLECSLDLYNP